MSDDRTLDAVVAGYLCVDLAPRFPRKAERADLSQLLRPGSLTEVDGMDTSLGGVTANTGLAMRRFGRSVELSALLGKDGMGEMAAGLLEQRGGAQGVRRVEKPSTAFSVVIAPPGSDRCFLECPGCNEVFSPESVDWDSVARARLLHFGYPTLMHGFYSDGGRNLADMFARARELGAATSLDTTLLDDESEGGRADWQAILETALPRLDVFVPSAEELVRMMAPAEYAKICGKSGGGDPLEAIPEDLLAKLAGRILELGVSVLLIKAGSRGALLRTADVSGLCSRTALELDADWDDLEIRVPACKMDRDRFVNACGAGDAAVAGFLSAMLEGRPAQTAVRLAMIAGRDSLYGPDALSGLRDWEIMLAEAN